MDPRSAGMLLAARPKTFLASAMACLSSHQPVGKAAVLPRIWPNPGGIEASAGLQRGL